jgi:two-component system, LuxR family, sensor kinase FixL
VEVAVHDTGAGLSADVMGTLFTPFITTKADGLGIGLAITQRIVEAHAGAIIAERNPGGGATFSIMLPRAATVTESVQDGWMDQVHQSASTGGD